MIRLFHGTHKRFVKHPGLSLTDEPVTALAYRRGSTGTITVVDLDLDGLTIAEVEDYDPETDNAPGDDGETYGADVLAFADADPTRREHDTWRLMTPRALRALRVLYTIPGDWWEAAEDLDVPVDTRGQWVAEWTAEGAEAEDAIDYDNGIDEWRADQEDW